MMVVTDRVMVMNIDFGVDMADDLMVDDSCSRISTLVVVVVHSSQKATSTEECLYC
jgi:hypothetical protein